MAKVALRNYNKEIEQLIEQGGIDEAIGHCRHILKTYPKYLEVLDQIKRLDNEYKCLEDEKQTLMKSINNGKFIGFGKNTLRGAGIGAASGLALARAANQSSISRSVLRVAKDIGESQDHVFPGMRFSLRCLPPSYRTTWWHHRPELVGRFDHPVRH